MALLDIAKRAAALLTLPDIDQVIGNTNNNARQIQEIIQQSGNALCLMTNSQGGGWSVLDRINEFQTQAGVTEYDLPADFKKLIVNTAWQKDKYWLLRGSLSAKQWQRIRNRQSSISYNVFRIVRTSGSVGAVPVNGAPNLLRKFTLEPAPGEATTLVNEYISNGWWISADGGTIKTKPTDDTDESLFGDDMHVLDTVWRMKSANSFTFSADLAVFEDYRDTAFAQDEAAEDPIPIGYSGRIYANKDESDVCWEGRW